MALSVGSRLGHYEVSALIGEGGMGQVYQATDTKLNRQVALKILPEAFAADPDRLARFQREAQEGSRLMQGSPEANRCHPPLMTVLLVCSTVFASSCSGSGSPEAPSEIEAMTSR